MKPTLIKLTVTLSLILGFSLNAHAVNQAVGNMINQAGIHTYAEEVDPCEPEELDGFESGDIYDGEPEECEEEEEIPANKELGPGWVRFVR